MLLTNLTNIVKEMLLAQIKVFSFSFTYGIAEVKVLISAKDEKKVDMILAITGVSKTKKRWISRLFAFHLEAPFRSIRIEPEDYSVIVDLLCRSGGGDSGNGNVWQKEPFNLFAFIEQHMPAHPPVNQSRRENIKEFFDGLDRSCIQDPDKRIFCGYRRHESDGKHVRAQNLAKTLAFGNYSAYKFCAENNVSTCWTDDPAAAKSFDMF